MIATEDSLGPVIYTRSNPAKGAYTPRGVYVDDAAGCEQHPALSLWITAVETARAECGACVRCAAIARKRARDIAVSVGVEE